MGFNSGFKGLIKVTLGNALLLVCYRYVLVAIKSQF